MPDPATIQSQVAPVERALAHEIAVLFGLQGDEALRRLDRIQRLFTDLPSPDQAAALLDPALSDQLATLLQDSAETAYSAAADTMSGELRLGMSFDLAHPRAVSFLKDYGAQQSELIISTTKDDIQRLLVQAADEGWPYTRLAKQIKALHQDYGKAVTRPRHIRSRAELIAVTELGNAYQQGMLDTVADAGSLGLKFEKSWLTVGDDRVSDPCRGNQGAGWIALADAFSSGDQRPLEHPGCRCACQFRRQK